MNILQNPLCLSPDGAIHKLLIANRGEIACRIIKTAQQLGIQAIAIFSEIDRQARHVRLADEAYLLGPAPSQDSYLNMERILQIAQTCNADAIHPGYGFLSEQADFANLCAEQGIIFIGPSSEAMTLMADKAKAKHIMQKAGVPVLPSQVISSSDINANTIAELSDIGFPLLIKPVAGGGGKGMYKVEHPEHLATTLANCMREAKTHFNNPTLLVEKYLPAARHIEVQIFADQQGNVVHLWERECTIQRRQQKMLEEAPVPYLNQRIKQALRLAAITAAKTINYVGAGTIEFILDTSNNEFYFIEMNTRLQVEHPVTEMITGLDLVSWQILVANGDSLPLKQTDIQQSGHAIEARLYAEDPERDFMPCTGTIEQLHLPTTSTFLRIDHGLQVNDQISVYYDPMLAKIIAWGRNRYQALLGLQSAFLNWHLVGVTTNQCLLTAILKRHDYANQALNTQWLENHIQELLISRETPSTTLLYTVAGLYQYLSQQQKQGNSSATNSPWQQISGWRLNETSTAIYCYHWQQHIATITIQPIPNQEFNVIYQERIGENSNPERHEEKVQAWLTDNDLHLLIQNKLYCWHIYPENNGLQLVHSNNYYQLNYAHNHYNQSNSGDTNTSFTAPMPGTISKIWVDQGQQVQQGDPLLALEAMKMEHIIRAPSTGTVVELFYQTNDQVDEGVLLLKWEAAEK